MTSRFRWMVVVAPMVSLLSGCGGGTETQEERDRKAEAYAKSLGANVAVSTNPDGSRSVAVGGPGGAQGGMNLAKPDGFPDDVPIYPQLNIVASNGLPGQGFMLQGQTADGLQQVADFYTAQMTTAGWTGEAATEQLPTMRVLPFKKGNRTAHINLIAGNGTTVQLTTMTMP